MSFSARQAAVVAGALIIPILSGCGGSRHTTASAVVVIGRGRTLAGTAYVASASRGEGTSEQALTAGGGVHWFGTTEKQAPHAENPACPISVSVTTSGGSGDGGCLDRSGSQANPSVTCQGGQLTVTSTTLQRTQSVRLALSDGVEVTTAALRVPAPLGPSAGFYYQVLPGPTPIPVSLTELAGGKILRVVMLPAVVECTKEPLKFLPGGVRTLARGRSLGGSDFSISGERYRFLGHVYFDLAAEVVERGSGEGGGGGSFSPQRSPGVFAWNTEQGCLANSHIGWSIVYGLLRGHGEEVYVRAGRQTHLLRSTAIPAVFHAGGRLAYIVLSRQPERVLVKAFNGRTVLDEATGLPASQDCSPGVSSAAMSVGR